MWNLDTKDWVIVGATIAGPILAVQAQKLVERARSSSQRRQWIFETLMATRQARVSIEHVRALNMIDLAFYGQRLLGRPWRSKSAQAVLDAWHDYHRHLTLPPERRPQSDSEGQVWEGRADELFTNLLDRLAITSDYKFERAQLKTGSYSPEAHGTVEIQQQLIRQHAIAVLSGNKHLGMDIRSLPADGVAAEKQHNLMSELTQNQKEMMKDFKEILEKLSDKVTR